MQSPTFVALNRVWASSETDAWATGTSKLIHWNGTSWSVVANPPGASHGFEEVSGSGPNDVYITDFAQTDTIYHWTGSAFTKVSVGGNYFWHAVTGTGANDVWVAGICETSPYGCVAHWDGTTWTVIHTGIALSLNDIWVGTDGINLRRDDR